MKLKIGALVFVLFILLYFCLGLVLKYGIQKVGPLLTLSPVDVSIATLSPITGRANIRGFKIGNPKGYEGKYAITVGSFKVKLKPTSIASKVVRIQEVVIDKPEIFYETNSSGNNLVRLQTNVESFSPSSQSSSQGDPKKVIIDRLVIHNGKIHWKMDLPLPDIELKNIGTESGGVTFAQASSTIFRSLTSGTSKGLAGMGESAKGVLGKASTSIKGLFKKR